MRVISNYCCCCKIEVAHFKSKFVQLLSTKSKNLNGRASSHHILTKESKEVKLSPLPPTRPTSPNNQKRNTMRPPSPSLPEKEFLIHALEQNLRLDGRAALEMRTPELMFGDELGCVECVFGKTRCVFLFLLFPACQPHPSFGIRHWGWDLGLGLGLGIRCGKEGNDGS